MKKTLLIVFVALAVLGCSKDTILRVDNQSPYAIDGVFVTSSSSSSWGNNLISSTIFAGTSRDVVVPSGYVDSLAVSSSSSVYWDAYGYYLDDGGQYTWPLYALGSEAGQATAGSAPSSK